MCYDMSYLIRREVRLLERGFNVCLGLGSRWSGGLGRGSTLSIMVHVLFTAPPPAPTSSPHLRAVCKNFGHTHVRADSNMSVRGLYDS